MPGCRVETLQLAGKNMGRIYQQVNHSKPLSLQKVDPLLDLLVETVLPHKLVHGLAADKDPIFV